MGGRGWMRTLGIALIAFPEPFTTPVGLTFLLLSYALFRKSKADSYYRLRALLGDYVAHFVPFGCTLQTQKPVHHVINRSLVVDHYSTQYRPENVVHHVLDRDRLLRSAQLATAQASNLIGYAQIHSRAPEKIVHHSLDMSRLLRGQQSREARGSFEGYVWRSYPATQKVVHQTLNRSLALA